MIVARLSLNIHSTLEWTRRCIFRGVRMNDIATVALCFCTLATFAHLFTTGLVIWRFRRPAFSHSLQARETVTIIRPVCGLDHMDALTLRSTFLLDHRDYEIIFCCAREDDAGVPLLRALMLEFPGQPARLLIGDDRPTANPKLNNIVKGWRAASKDWIVLADSNVLLPPGYIDALLSCYTPDAGLVCSPPIGSMPTGFASELECAFLNGYQARWQCAADSVGFGFAQGKSMLWRRGVLDAAGGIVALGSEIAEDAAATKIVRSLGLGVRLVQHPFEQPLGAREAKAVWNRQVRWARLRRATFPLYYIPEVIAGSALPIAAGTYAAFAFAISPLAAFISLICIWHGAEAALTRAAGWHISLWSPVAWTVRDFLLPILWVQGWTGDTFTWRGNAMTVAESEMRPSPSEARA